MTAKITFVSTIAGVLIGLHAQAVIDDYRNEEELATRFFALQRQVVDSCEHVQRDLSSLASVAGDKLARYQASSPAPYRTTLNGLPEGLRADADLLSSQLVSKVPQLMMSSLEVLHLEHARYRHSRASVMHLLDGADDSRDTELKAALVVVWSHADGVRVISNNVLSMIANSLPEDLRIKGLTCGPYV